MDVNGDGRVAVSDAGILVNAINAGLIGPIEDVYAARDYSGKFLDVSGDGLLTQQDIARVINRINAPPEPVTGKQSLLVGDLQAARAATAFVQLIDSRLASDKHFDPGEEQQVSWIA